MTFEEEFKRPVIGPVTELNNTMQAVFRQYRAHREYTSELEKSNKGLKEKVMELENENTFLRDKHTQFGANGMAVVPITKPLPEVPKELADWIENYIDINEIAIQFVLDDFVKTKIYSKIRDNVEKYGAYDKLIYEAINYGYTVEKEKEKKFYLKSKSLLISDSDYKEPDVDELYFNKDGNLVISESNAYKFTQQEIDSLETGSYERIEVEE